MTITDPAALPVPALDLAPLTPSAYAAHVLGIRPALATPTRDDVDTLAEAVRASVAAGDIEAATAAETVRRILVALLPDDDGEHADRLDAEHNDGKHEPNELPHACPLCAEDCDDPFGMFPYGARTPADTVARLAALLPVPCNACSYLAHDAADLDEHRGIHEEDAEELAADNAAGAAMLAEEPTAAEYAAAARILDRDHLRRPLPRS